MLRVRIGLHRGNLVGSTIPGGAGDGLARPVSRSSRTPEGRPGALPEGSEHGTRERLGQFTFEGNWPDTDCLGSLAGGLRGGRSRRPWTVPIGFSCRRASRCVGFKCLPGTNLPLHFLTVPHLSVPAKTVNHSHWSAATHLRAPCLIQSPRFIRPCREAPVSNALSCLSSGPLQSPVNRWIRLPRNWGTIHRAQRSGSGRFALPKLP